MRRSRTILLAVLGLCGAAAAQTFLEWSDEPRLLGTAGGVNFYSMLPSPEEFPTATRYYRFDNTNDFPVVQDLSPNNNDIAFPQVASNNPTFVAASNGMAAYYSFDKTDFLTGKTFNAEGTLTNGTLSAWVRLGTDDASRNDICRWQYTSTNRTRYLMLADSGADNTFLVAHYSNTVPNWRRNAADGSLAGHVTGWMNLVVTRDGTNTVTYLNSQAIASSWEAGRTNYAAYLSSIIDIGAMSVDTFWIGGYSDGRPFGVSTGSWFRGDIGEVRHDNFSMTAGQVYTNLFSASRANFGWDDWTDPAFTNSVVVYNVQYPANNGTAGKTPDTSYEAETASPNIGSFISGHAPVWAADGTNGYLVCDGDDGVSFPVLGIFDGSQDFTVMFWFYTENLDNKHYWRPLAEYQWSILNNKASAPGKITAFHYDGVATDELNGTTTIESNTWYHVALTYVSGATSRLYLNGVEEDSGTLDTDPAAAAFVNTWGANHNGAAPVNGITGRLRGKRVYNRGLSSNDVNLIYTREKTARSL